MSDDEKIKRVVGLKYAPASGPPRVILKGAGPTADQVLARARELGAHRIVKDRQLLDRLFRLPVDAPIDTDLFQLVAVLLVHLYALDDVVNRVKEDQLSIPKERKTK